MMNETRTTVSDAKGKLTGGKLSSAVRVILLSAAALCASHVVYAVPVCTPQKAETADMGEGTYADIQASMELLAQKKTQEAIDKLSKTADKGSAYEKAVVNYNLGFAYSSKEDHASAVKAFAKALSLNALPRAQSEQLKYNLGQLYIVSGQFEEGIKTLQDYIENACGNVPAEAHSFLANALTERKRFDEALPQI